ncbi:MAG: aminotransferase class IV [Fimbriiglobus sp.]
MGRVFVDGRVFDKYSANISVYDHGLLYGDGATVSLRIRRGEPFLASGYLSQLLATCKQLNINCPYTSDEFMAILRDLIAQDARRQGYLKIIVTRGAGMLAHDPRKCTPAVIVICDDVVPYPFDLLESGLQVITAKTSRDHRDATQDSRTLHAGKAVRAKQEALDVGCLDAIILDDRGSVTGTVDAALLVVRGGQILTPPLEVSPDAVYVQHLMTFAEIQPTELTVNDLLSAEELALAGSIGGLVPITHLDARAVGGGVIGPVVQSLRAKLLQFQNDDTQS